MHGELESLAPTVGIREIIKRIDSCIRDSWIRKRPVVDHARQSRRDPRGIGFRRCPRLHRECRRVCESVDRSACALDRHERIVASRRHLRIHLVGGLFVEHLPESLSRVHLQPPCPDSLQESVFLAVASSGLERLRFHDPVRPPLTLLEVKLKARACSPSDRLASADDCGSRELAQSSVIQLDLHLITHSLTPLRDEQSPGDSTLRARSDRCKAADPRQPHTSPRVQRGDRIAKSLYRSLGNEESD
nr:MAG TPA: hypothetical protein [Caudoviricetes sp.]